MLRQFRFKSRESWSIGTSAWASNVQAEFSGGSLILCRAPQFWKAFGVGYPGRGSLTYPKLWTAGMSEDLYVTRISK